MKWKIFALLGLFAVSLTVIAQVLLTNLDQKSFIIDVTGQPTNVVNLHLRNTQFSPSTTGWVLTNISGVYGGSTNITTNSIWGIDGFGNITPIVTNNAVIATNIVRYGSGRMFGTESWLSKAITLTNGPNYLGAAENSQFFLIGPTTNPADCQIILSNAVATGQKLVLVNQTNAIPAEGAWTMTNNTPIPDGAGVVKLLGGYDLVSTNGYISYFEFISPDWQEVGRILASGASGLLTNVFNNIVVYSNITLRGNSTLTINNITISTNDLWHTNLVGGVATLQPVNLGLQPMIVKGLTVGTNTTSSALLPAALANNVLSSVGNTDAGDPVERYIYIAQATSNGNPRSWLKSVVLTNSNSFQLGGNDGTSQVTFDILELGGNDFQFLVQTNAATILNIHPTATDGNVAYTLDTDRTHTIGHILDINNNQTNLWSFGVVSSGHIPEFAMFPPENNFSSIRSTNGINFNIDGASAYQWRINGLGFEPEFDGSTLASTLHPINGGHFNNVIWGDGGAGVADTSGNGSPEGVAAAAVGSVWRNTNGTPGAVLYVKESGTGNTGWTAIGSGVGGSTLWYAYTLPDVEGGTVYGTGSTNAFYPNMVRFSNNKLTNFWGTFSGSLSAGWSTPDPATLDSTENVAIFNIGDLAGNGMNTTNSYDIYNFGDGAGNLMTTTGASGQSAGDIFNFGNVAGQQMAASQNSKNIYNFGTFAGQQMTLYGSQQIYNIGDSAGMSSTATNSTDLYIIGQNAGRTATYQTSSDIFAFGNASLQNSVLTNSTDVIGLGGALIGVKLTNSTQVTGLGRDSGNSIAGAFTNMVFIGAGATAGSGSANQVVMGPGMSLLAPAITLQGQSLFTTLTNKVLKSGDTMTGTLLVTGLTNSARTANTFVVSGSDKSDVSTGTSAMLAATLSDETGTGAAVFGTSPTFNTSLTLTNPTTGTIAMVINQASGGTVTNFLAFNLGGTNWMYFDQSGQIFGRSSTTGPGALLKFTDTGNIAVTRFDVPTRNYVTLGFSPGVGLTSAGQVSWSNSTTDSTSAETILTRDSQNVIQIGTDGINVLTYAMKAGDGSGTDKGGSHYATKGGQSTGSGPPGDLIYQTSLYTNSSGNTANPYTTRGQVIGRPCALTNATATSFQRFTMATNTQAGINIFATVKVIDAAFARQSISSYVRVDAVNVNGTITATVSETDNTLAASTGTLTIAYTVVDEGSNILAIRANANTSLTATPSIKWIITGINSDGAITVTPVQL